jgi:AcrR family transcriptional regulator
MSTSTNDQRLKKGTQTRHSILETAVQLASKEGLESLSIGRLASLLNMSKSGLFAHFGSKESLQLSTIEAAIDVFRDSVIRPAMMRREKGLSRLWALCNSFLEYEQQKVFGGGCFFATVTSEFKNRPGMVRDTLVVRMKDWLSLITSLVQDAKDMGDLADDIKVDQIAFEIQSLFIGGNWAFQFHHDHQAIDRVREAIRQRLRQIATPQAMNVLEQIPDFKPRNQ